MPASYASGNSRTGGTDQSRYAYAVHITRPEDLGVVEIVFVSEKDAREYVKSRSTDHLVTAASVTRYMIGQLGTRTPLALFVDGHEQPRPDLYHGRARLYPSG